MRLQAGDIVHPIDNGSYDETETMFILDTNNQILVFLPIETTPYTEYLFNNKENFYWEQLDLVLLTTIFRE